MTRNRMLATLAATALVSFFSLSRPVLAEFEGQINLIGSDGTILIYAGEDSGLKKGDELPVYRDGVQVGTIEITEVKKTFSKAKAGEGEGALKEGDRIGGKPSAAETSKREPKTEGSDAGPKRRGPSASGKADEKEEKTDKKASSKSAKKDDGDEDKKEEDESDEEDVAKVEKKSSSKKKEGDEEKAEETKAGSAPKPFVPAVGSAATGMSGMQLNVNGRLLAKGQGLAHVNMLDFGGGELAPGVTASSATLYGLSYGFEENIEVSLGQASVSLDQGAGDFDSTFFGVKYKLDRSMLKSRNVEGRNRIDSVVGLQYFTQDGNDVSRLFVAATTPMYRGVITGGFYENAGDALQNAVEGFGFFGGYELTVSEKAHFLVEFDDKDFFRNRTKGMSAGLRYQATETGLLDLSLSDPSDDSIVTVGASYQF